MAQTVYGNSLPLHVISIDGDAYWAIKKPQNAVAYVGFLTINAAKPMSKGLLIHELVHVWQYHTVGSAYIIRALWAQTTQAGYDYGGTTALESLCLEEKDLLSFNYEQQGDVMQDYFRIKNGYLPLWGYGVSQDLHLYEYFLPGKKS